jgi:inorganic pyrophosphatase
MKKAIEKLDAFDREKKCLNVVVETPKGSCVKYAFSPESGLFELKCALSKGLEFPFNFGFIPATLGQDGDPLDILILNEEPLVPGCLVKTRLLGVIKAVQTEEGKSCRNDRLIGIGLGEKGCAHFPQELDDNVVQQIEFFFVAYNRQRGKKFKVKGLGSLGQARKIILAGQKRHRQKNKS